MKGPLRRLDSTIRHPSLAGFPKRGVGTGRGPRTLAALAAFPLPHSHWMNTMYRCLFALAAAAAIAAPALAQVQRNFPQNALRGTVVFGQPPVISLNGEVTRLSPGARVRDLNNMGVLTGQLIDLKAVVNYTIDASGQVHDVWILRPEEVKMRPWPVTTEQARAWTFDPAAQTWHKP